MKSSAICATALALLLGLSECPATLAAPQQVPFLNRDTPKKELGQFLHITDMHLDPYYEEGASIGKSCHPKAGKVLKKKKGKKGKDTTEDQAGKYGAPGSGCDSPLRLINETMRFAGELLNQNQSIDFIIWTGDSARHDSDSDIVRTEGEIQALNALAVDYFVSVFPSTTIVPNIGNNDIWPHNDLIYTPTEPNPTLDFFVNLWSRFIPSSQRDTFRRHGSFLIEVIPNVLVASVNTMYLSDGNKQVGDCRKKDSDPPAAGDDVLQWLEEDVLKYARQQGKVVHVMGHVPPTLLNYYDNCYEKFAALMVGYADVVVGQFYGHMNIDHFFFPTSSNPVGDEDMKSMTPDFSRPLSLLSRVSAYIPSWLSLYYHYLLTHYKHQAHQLRKKPNKPIPQPVFVSPSVVPSFNPSLRVFNYYKAQDNSVTSSLRTGELTGYTQYIADIGRWNKEPLEENAEFPGYIYETSYKPSTLYAFPDGEFGTKAWVEFGGRMTGVGTGKEEGARLSKLYVENMAVRLEGVVIKDVE